MRDNVRDCLNYIRKITDFVPDVALILGSGLGGYTQKMDEVICSIPYSRIPGFPVSTVSGHSGKFVMGYVKNVPIICMDGRVHYYEGYSPEDVVLPTRVMRALGAKVLFITNAAGGVNEDLTPGSLVVLRDHVSLFVPNPLKGINDPDEGVRFPDMTEVYDRFLRRIIEECAARDEIPITEGVYCQLSGPSYETPYEIKILGQLGVDLVGMSTVMEAIAGKQKILVYGDYDVDGTTAVSLVYSFIRRFTDQVDFYIPDRYDEGYGVSYKSIDWAAEGGFKLLITLDCGIKAVEKVDYAREKGIDVIICDHHLPGESLPAAVAVLDPKREDCHYPFDDLSGCGVGFKLVQAYSKSYDIPFETLIPLLDLLVVSIASDLVTMVGENRVLAHFGLKQLNENPRKGLLALITLSNLEPGHVTVDDIVFKIGPRINAAGRMETGRLAVELLKATDSDKAVAIGEQINASNNDRKNMDREITQNAIIIPSGTRASWA